MTTFLDFDKLAADFRAPVFATTTPEVEPLKFILAFIAAILLLASISDTAQSQRRRRPIRRVPKPTVASKPSPIGQTPSGLIYVITRHGEGPQAKAGDTVNVHYTGVLTSGVKFDSSLDRGEPYSFELGAGRVIKGSPNFMWAIRQRWLFRRPLDMERGAVAPFRQTLP